MKIPILKNVRWDCDSGAVRWRWAEGFDGLDRIDFFEDLGRAIDAEIEAIRAVGGTRATESELSATNVDRSKI